MAETGKGRGQRGAGKAARAARLVALAAVNWSLANALAADLPAGGAVVAGSGTISQSGKTMTVHQTTGKLAIDWNNFSIGHGNTVSFAQPSASAVALNRVLGADVSSIQGALNANGQVFLVNPNGILFTPTAQINVGSLVASTLNIKTEDFLSGRYRFEGASGNAIVNQGRIDAASGGTIALIAARIVNDGSLTANAGNVLLGAGSRVTLDMDGPVRLDVANDTLETLIQNGGAIKADGGVIWMTSQAAHRLAASAINNTGLIEAQAMATGEKGEIVLFAHGGEARVGGTIAAAGGFVETSGKVLSVMSGTKIEASNWLIDPVDINIDAALAGAIGTALDSGNVTITATGSNAPSTAGGESAGAGDINVSSAINKTSGAASTLTLAAHRNITVSDSISGAPGSPLNVVLAARSFGAANGHINIYGNASAIKTYGGDVTVGGGDQSASGYAVAAGSVNGGYFAGVSIGGNAVIDASGDGLGMASVASTGGNIIIRGKGDAITNNYANWGVWLNTGLIATAGNGNIEITGYGGNGNNFWSVGSSGISLERNVNAVAANGNIILKGYKGNGGDAYGIVSSETSKILRTAGYLSLDGDSLMIREGELTVDVGRDSDIKAPVFGCLNGEGCSNDYRFTKLGSGILNLSGNAQTWVAPASTSGIATTGMFTDASNNVNIVGMTSGEALASFSTRPGAVNVVTASTAVPANSGGSPVALNFTLGGNIDLTYNGSAYRLTDIWSASSIFGNSYGSWNLGTDYQFMFDNNVVTGFTHAGTYNNISVGILKSGFATAATGNTLGSVLLRPRPVTITADSVSKTYGSADPALTWTVTSGSLVGGDTLSGSLARVSGENAGSYTIGKGTLANSDYQITANNGTFTIDPRPISIDVASHTKTYGDADPVLTWSLASGSLVGGDTLSGGLARAPGEKVGGYAIGKGTLANGNYLITVNDGTMTIVPEIDSAAGQETSAGSVMSAKALQSILPAPDAQGSANIIGMNGGLLFVQASTPNDNANEGDSKMEIAVAVEAKASYPALLPVVVMREGVRVPDHAGGSAAQNDAGNISSPSPRGK